jgi:hypothetical protein
MRDHWVWASFTPNFVKPVACLAVLADFQSRALEYATTIESYLNNNNIAFREVGWMLPHTGHYQRRPDSLWLCRTRSRKKMERTPESLPPD